MPEQTNISDPYFMAYNIMLLALKDKKMSEGLTKALYFTKLCFDANNVILYEQNEQGDFVHKNNSALMDSNSRIVTAILNSAKGLVSDQKYYEFQPNFEGMHNITFVNVETEGKKYVVALTGDKEFKNLNEHFLTVFAESMSAVLGKAEEIEALQKTSTVDLLTSLDNRNAYESTIAGKNPPEGMTYAIFDLFRLKNINDKYSHQKGDEYIKKTAEILKKHFPKFIYTIDPTGKKTMSETGNYLFRIGGDEFILLSTTETYESIQLKTMIIQEEVRRMDLGVDEHLGINCGLTQAEQGETFRNLYLKSDSLLSENKKEHYAALGIERRK